MSCSKPLPPFTFDLLCFLNRDQLERSSIVCRPLKNLIDRYFQRKPYRVFDQLEIWEGSCVLVRNDNGNGIHVQWHPNRDDYSVQQFLAGQHCSIDSPFHGYVYYSFAEMRRYLSPTVRTKRTMICVGGGITYHPEHIEEMESITHLWRDSKLDIWNQNNLERIVAEDFQLILNSPTILQCRDLDIEHAHFPFKDYKILYTVQVIRVTYDYGDVDRNFLDYWPQFLEQPGVKPIVSVVLINRENIANILDRLCEAFSSAVVPNAFKVVFALWEEEWTEFRKTNKTSAEKLELKKGIPIGYEQLDTNIFDDYNNYTLERSSI